MANAAPKKTSSRDKVRAYRARMRAQGLRPVQIWIPDTRTPEFIAEARRQSLAVANSPTEKEDQAFVDAVSAFWDEE
jgi:DNA-binding LacI/PurR family transcriptional regulator